VIGSDELPSSYRGRGDGQRGLRLRKESFKTTRQLGGTVRLVFRTRGTAHRMIFYYTKRFVIIKNHSMEFIVPLDIEIPDNGDKSRK